jgi:hypothetical protein
LKNLGKKPWFRWNPGLGSWFYHGTSLRAGSHLVDSVFCVTPLSGFCMGAYCCFY